VAKETGEQRGLIGIFGNGAQTQKNTLLEVYPLPHPLEFA